MADEIAATQLPLFEEHELFLKPDLPTRWNAFGRTSSPTLLTDLTNVNLHAVASPSHRDARARQDREREERVEELALRACVQSDDVWAAYANYSGGRTDYSIFQDFAQVCELAIRHSLTKVWFEKLGSKPQPSKTAPRQAGLYGAKIFPLRQPKTSRLSALSPEPGLSNTQGGVFTTPNTKSLDRNGAEPREFPRRQPQ